MFGPKKEKEIYEAEKKMKITMQQIGASNKQIESATQLFKKEIKNVPLPKIAIIGFTGVGKSTTLNALFNAGRPTNDVRPCTQSEAPIVGDVSKYTGSKGSVIIYDMPGLGEDLYSDRKHFDTYIRVLPIVDIAVWTFHTGDRSMTPMQEALQGLIKYLGNDFQNKLMFAINKADAIAPGESAWDTKLNSPSLEQRRNITELELYIQEKIRQILPVWNGKLVTYSATKHFRLSQLMTAMVETLPKERRWVLESVSDVADPRWLMDKSLQNYVNSLQKNCKKINQKY